MKAWVPAEPAETSRLKPSTPRGVLERWLGAIGRSVNSVIQHFLRRRNPASQFKAEEPADYDTQEAVVTPIENGIVDLAITKTFTVPITAGVNVDTDTPIDIAASTVVDQEEIQRRRNLVRMLFNDFWSGAYEKPAAFVERLNQAEDYLNERLTANGEAWRLDATTRTLLGLPPRSSSPD
jgi:hypothetical protein